MNSTKMLYCLGCLFVLALAAGCASTHTRRIEVTAYCGCGECNNYRRGSWWFLKVNFWDKHIDSGPHAGERYDGRTASGARPYPPNPGLISLNSLTHPWWIPVRAVLPWLWLPYPGTLAADTQYYPFGTEIYVPGWGWGVIEDRGLAITGPNRLDAFFRWHWQTEDWGRQDLVCKIRGKE